MQTISKISLPIIATAIIAGIASLCVNSSSQLFTILDTTAVVGFISLFALGSVASANAFKEIQLITDTAHRITMKVICNFAGIFSAMVSIGYLTLLLIAKMQNLDSIRELSFYGRHSDWIALTIGTLFYFICRTKGGIRFRILAIGFGMLGSGLALISIFPGTTIAEYPPSIIPVILIPLGSIILVFSLIFIKEKHVDRLREESNSQFIKWLLVKK